MNFDAVLNFLIPDLSDPLQVTFLFLILFMMSFTIISAHVIAKPKSWEVKWNRGTPNKPRDNIEIEHGSVTDLWNAVATAPEKLVELMPSLLLVVGLLGTFLGLGMALNHASNILGQPNALDATGAADSMQHLLGLLNGLGTKFKTSTWGITGFIFLKIWSEFARFDEKRLNWVISKVKVELEKRKQQNLDLSSEKQAALFSTIAIASRNITEVLSAEFNQLRAQHKVQHEQGLHSLEQFSTHLREDIEALKLSGQVVIQEGFQKFNDEFSHSHSQTRKIIESSLKRVELAVEHVCIATKEVKESVKLVHVESQATNIAMHDFTYNTQKVVENMSEAAQHMASGANQVGIAANELVGAIDSFQAQFTEVLDNVRNDLGKAINDMSLQASETLERGSSQLGSATRDISTALSVLSSDVKQTMGDVKDSIEKTFMMQKEVSKEFVMSSSILNENIAMATENSEKVSNTIQDGLRAISDSNQKMRSIGDSLKKNELHLQEVICNLSNLPIALAPLVELSAHQDLLRTELVQFRQDFISSNESLDKNSLKLESAVNGAIERSDTIIQSLLALPELIRLLNTSPHSQQLLLALSPLPEITINQQALLSEIQKVREVLEASNGPLESEVA
ncbi:hypothetical protein [Shewanella xiamenensis]|uniref:hypothetical protein n=1 Tax=Shewanella xiamenensis TaxID=332186 RepID=UPI002E7B8E08|nr:hypothetical protein [Shewanella xiamenensis]MEE1982678.1 hypothetical protein [Shewanella xiamenensis]